MSSTWIHHVSVPRPPGSETLTRAFYGDLLGLQEVKVPESIRHLDLIWYRLGDRELHLFAEPPVGDTSGRHFCLAVDDLHSVRRRLVAAGYQPRETIPIPDRPRFFCADPFGNTIEFTQIDND